MQLALIPQKIVLKAEEDIEDEKVVGKVNKRGGKNSSTFADLI
jgi:hypothetical protein